ncbi:cyclin-dependent kinase 2-associated protein 1-like [Amphiura filiformis]|uniref:cyclin-dependent kinase 2-associated protein 1-like n=1 Tax=Amphiura filiformis TaxID=82378 RepID=UPI003B214AB4
MASQSGSSSPAPQQIVYRANPNAQVGAAAAAAAILQLSAANRANAPQSKYAELLAVIEDMGRDIRPTYSGSRTATERLKRGIIHARALVRECLAETERSARS